MNYKQFKAVFADALLPLGYTNVKNMYFRRIGDVFTIVDIDRAPWGGGYIINFGVFVDDGNSVAQPPPFYKTHLILSLQMVVPQTVGKTLHPALNLEVSMKAAERSAIIQGAIEQYLIPYLDSINTIEKLADYLSPERKNFKGVTLDLRDIIRRRTGREQAV